MNSSSVRAAKDDTEAAPQGAGRVLTALVFSAAFAAIISLIAFALEGKTGVEKALTSLAMPVGLVWLLGGGWVLQRLTRRPERHSKAGAVIQLIVWLAYYAITTAPLNRMCSQYLESYQAVYDPSADPPLDYLVVLGGGTSQGHRRAQVASSGDRVLYAAQLYLAGHAKYLVTTGSAAESSLGARTAPNEQTVEIWSSLGIPQNQIRMLNGRNTQEEILELRQVISEWEGKRVGLLTSAFHLPRALRLARKHGLQDLVPVAADYRTGPDGIAFQRLIPNAVDVYKLSLFQHEFMALIVDR